MTAARNILQCARPLIFIDRASGDHFLGGSCCRVQRGESLYLVTAGHCFKSRHATPCQVNILCGDTNCKWVPVRAFYSFNASSKDDNDHLDVAFCQVAQETLVPAEISEFQNHSISLNEPLPPLSLPDGWPMVIHGWPSGSEFSTYDYDSKRWTRKSVFLNGQYAGDTAYLGVSCLVLEDLAGLSDLDGLSGSPVFAAAPWESKCTFAGLVIRGGGPGNVREKNLYFIRRDVLTVALNAIEMRPRSV